MLFRSFAAKENRTAVFVTERAVLRLVESGLEVIEIAPGIDLEKDVLGQMAFRARVSPQLKRMDRRLFVPGLMNLRADLDAKVDRQSKPAGLRKIV